MANKLGKQSTNPQILRLIPLSKIRIFLRCASPQITNPQIFMISPQIANLQIYKILQTLSQNSPKVVFLHDFYYVQILIRALYVKYSRKGMYLRACGCFKSESRKKIGCANFKSAKCHNCGRPANLTNYFKSANLRNCDLRNLFCGPPLL